VDQIYFKFERLPYSKIRKLSTPGRTSLKHDTDSRPKMDLGSGIGMEHLIANHEDDQHHQQK
jgi:hypothetical protein